MASDACVVDQEVWRAVADRYPLAVFAARAAIILDVFADEVDLFQCFEDVTGE